MRIPRYPAEPASDVVEREDYLELTRGGSTRHTSASNRKALQLCSQVADTVNYVLSGGCDDELLQNLQVASVVPAPNASHLLVTVYPVIAMGANFDAAEVRFRLLEAVGRLRSEVARSITRKKAPKLLFQFVHLV